jgi:ketosteroid isomerase-like protein
VTSGAADVMRDLAVAINADDIQGVARLLDPDVVQYGTWGGVDQGRVIRGREAVLAYWDEVGEAWESQTFELQEVIEGEGVVVALWHESAQIRDSDLEVESSTASLIKIRDAKVVEMRGYMDPDEALSAAGLKSG